MLPEPPSFATEAEEDGVSGPEEELDKVRPKSAPVALWFVVCGTTGVVEGGLTFFGIRGIVWLQIAARGLGLVAVGGKGLFERG